MSINSLPRLKLKKLFLKLSQNSYFLRLITKVGTQVDPQQEDKIDRWRLFHQSNSGGARPVACINKGLMNELFSNGVLEQKDDLAVITIAGRVTIKRAIRAHNLGTQNCGEKKAVKQGSTNSHVSSYGASSYGDCLGQHQVPLNKRIDDGTLRRDVIVNSIESPLSWLATRKDRQGKPMIETHQFAAGEKLRSDYERAQLSAQITCNLDLLGAIKTRGKASGYQQLSINEASMDAKARITKAIDTVGPELAGILIDVCCEHCGLTEAEKRNDLPRRSGKIILRLALNQLARHYGFLHDTSLARAVYRRIGHWGADDYRPHIDG